MKKLSPQTQKVLDRMADGSWLDNVECVTRLHIFRLSNKIRDLQFAGYKIEHSHMEGNNVGKYRIIGRPPEIESIYSPKYLKAQKQKVAQLL